MQPVPALLGLLRARHRSPAPVLAAALGVDRAGLDAALAALRELGVPLAEDDAEGLGLAEPLDLLDADVVRAGLPAAAPIDTLTVLLDVDSTNRFLLDGREPGVHACLAERQSAGRGRRGRGWVSPFARSLYLSLRWPSARPMAALGGLSLAAGVAVAEALRAQGAATVGLKWPNDLVAGGAKLGGVLVELARGADRGTVAVLGVGVNGRLGTGTAVIDQPWTDLATLLGAAPDRNRLASAVLAALLDAMTEFEAHGLAPFRARYAALDSLAGRPVRVFDHEPFEGVARGVDEDGALLVDDGRARRRVMAGDVSVRAAGEAGRPA